MWINNDKNLKFFDTKTYLLQWLYGRQHKTNIHLSSSIVQKIFANFILSYKNNLNI